MSLSKYAVSDERCYEPFQCGDDTDAQSAFCAELRAHLDDGRETGLAFLLSSIMPLPMVEGMRGEPDWEAMGAVADTLVYDCLISETTGTDTLAAVDVPTLVLDCGASTETSGGWPPRRHVTSPTRTPQSGWRMAPRRRQGARPGPAVVSHLRVTARL